MKNLVIFIMVIGLTVGITLLPGCKKKESIKKQIYLLDLGIPEYMKWMSGVIKKFEVSHPGIKVKVEYVSGGTYNKFLVQLAGGNLPDVVNMNDTVYPDLVYRNAFLPLDKFIEKDKLSIEDFKPSALKYGTLNNTIYVIPMFTGSIVIFYNKDLFKEAGIPFPKDGWTWDEFKDVCKRLTMDKDGDGKIDQYALDGWGLLNWYPMILQNGGYIISPDKKKCLINSPEAIDAMRFVQDLFIRDKVLVSEIVSPSLKQMGGSAMMSNNKVAMTTGGFGAYLGFPDIDWDIVAPPEKMGGRRVFHGGCWGYAIPNGAKNPEAGWELIKYLTSKEIQSDMLKNYPMDMPTRESVIPEFIALMPDKRIGSYVYAATYPNYDFQIKRSSEILSSLEELEFVVRGVTKGDLTEVANKVSQKINNILAEK